MDNHNNYYYYSACFQSITNVTITGPPANITVVSPSSRSLTVTWSPPVNLERMHGVIVSFTVKCGSFNTSSNDRLSSIEIIKVSFSGLLPYTSYNCCVSVKTTIANSSVVCHEGTTLEEGNVGPS